MPFHLFCADGIGVHRSTFKTDHDKDLYKIDITRFYTIEDDFVQRYYEELQPYTSLSVVVSMMNSKKWGIIRHLIEVCPNISCLQFVVEASVLWANTSFMSIIPEGRIMNYFTVCLHNAIWAKAIIEKVFETPFFVNIMRIESKDLKESDIPQAGYMQLTIFGEEAHTEYTAKQRQKARLLAAAGLRTKISSEDLMRDIFSYLQH